MVDMDTSLTFREFKESDLKGLSRMLGEVFGTRKFRNSDYLKWKYLDNPAGRILSIVATSGSRITSQFGAIPVRFCVSGKETVFVQEVDIAGSGESGRYDFLFNMYRLKNKLFREKGVEVIYSFSSGLTSKLGEALQLKRKLGPVPRLIKILDSRPFLAKKFPHGPFPGLLSVPVNAALNIRGRGETAPPPGKRLVRIDRFDSRFDEFWDRIRNDYPIMAKRSADHLNWRYADAVHTDFTIFCLEGEGTGEIGGYIVLGERKDEYVKGQIIDIVTPRDSDPPQAACLVKRAVEHFRRRKAALINCWMFPHCHLYPALAEAGFKLMEINGKDCLLEILESSAAAAASREFLQNRENWFLTKGDSDHD